MAVNKLFYGDNLDVLRRKIREETVDLCYIGSLAKPVILGRYEME